MTEKVIVTVKEGKVRGFKTKTAYSGAEYYTFLGVPYGQSTEGSARYKVTMNYLQTFYQSQNYDEN